MARGRTSNIAAEPAQAISTIAFAPASETVSAGRFSEGERFLTALYRKAIRPNPFQERNVTGRRVHERYEIQLPVVITHEGRQFDAVTHNVSLGGMYLVTTATLPYNARIQMQFRLPALKEQTVCTVTVRWKKPDGIGVQFGSLRALEVWGLNQLFKTALSQGA